MTNPIKKEAIGLRQVGADQIGLENNLWVKGLNADGSALLNLFKLDDANKFIFANTPELLAGATPTTGARSFQIKSQIDALIQVEVDRAMFEETTLGNAINAEVQRAQAAEQDLQEAIDAEEARALAAEAGLQSDIDGEISRATAAEAGLQSDIDDEIARATAAEAGLQSDIDAEIARALAAEALLIPLAQKGAASGVAPLGADSKVPTIYLPSYVDDVVEIADYASLPATGEQGKIYVVLAAGNGYPANFQYRWTGTQYSVITASPGTTDNVVEGSVNLYYTEARVNALVDPRFDAVEADVADHETRITDLRTEVDDHETRITAIETQHVPTWHSMPKVTVNGTIATNGYIDMAHEIPSELLPSLSVYVDKFALHRGEDYSVSTVGGVSRVTFIGRYAPGGAEALTAAIGGLLGRPADQIFSKYQY